MQSFPTWLGAVHSTHMFHLWEGPDVSVEHSFCTPSFLSLIARVPTKPVNRLLSAPLKLSSKMWEHPRNSPRPGSWSQWFPPIRDRSTDRSLSLIKAWWNGNCGNCKTPNSWSAWGSCSCSNLRLPWIVWEVCNLCRRPSSGLFVCSFLCLTSFPGVN